MATHALSEFKPTYCVKAEVSSVRKKCGNFRPEHFGYCGNYQNISSNSFQQKASFSPSNGRAKHTLPELPYEYAALEPTICREIMELHHQKHHAGYVNNLNLAEEQLAEALAANHVTNVIKLGRSLKFNGGGHLNHSLFWENLTPLCTAPSKALEASVKHNFYSMEDFKAMVRGAALGVQGSGWVWLGWDKDRKLLRVATTKNQDPLEATTGLMPLLGVDLWEHAYYLQYKNDRTAYFDALWEIINWKEVSKRYEKLRCTVNK